MSIDYRSGGLKPGHFSFIPTYDPEGLVAYELGCKGQMSDSTVLLNASAYFYEHDDIRLQYDTSGSWASAPRSQTLPQRG